MTNVSLGGHTYTTQEVIAAIQASDNANQQPQGDADKYQVLQNLVNSLMTRIDILEKNSPTTREAFVVSKEVASSGAATFKVRMLNELGQHIFVTFEVPADV